METWQTTVNGRVFIDLRMKYIDTPSLLHWDFKGLFKISLGLYSFVKRGNLLCLKQLGALCFEIDGNNKANLMN